MVRILCLHGTAINPAIFRSKTEKLRNYLPEDYTYEWFSGDKEVVPQKFLGEVYPGPYLTYIDFLTTENIGAALDRIEEFIEEEGPFDGVMGVSEGSMLASSLILKHQNEKPFDPPLFRFAIFIAGALPFTWSPDYGYDVYGLLMSQNPLSVDAKEWIDHNENGEVNPQSLQFSGHLVLTDMFPNWEQRRQELAEMHSNPDNAHLKPHCYHPDISQERINIPTAHTWGTKDIFIGHAMALLELCEPSMAAHYIHDGEHDVPHTVEHNKRFSEIVKKTILRSDFAI
ncbi:serine hydrolase FSH [Xylariales sp. PMI_506]|nr:serine hydrolase FSH [Xylariales sp. PMI_506]